VCVNNLTRVVSTRDRRGVRMYRAQRPVGGKRRSTESQRPRHLVAGDRIVIEARVFITVLFVNPKMNTLAKLRGRGSKVGLNPSCVIAQTD